MADYNLKPYTFCGAPVTLYYDSQDDTFRIFHTFKIYPSANDNFNCCIAGSIMLDAVSPADAAKVWNRRADNG